MTAFLLYYYLTFQPQTFILLIALKKKLVEKLISARILSWNSPLKRSIRLRKPLTKQDFVPRTYVSKFSIFFNSAYNHPTIQTVQEGIHPKHLPESALRLRQSETWNSFDLYRTICSQSLSHVAQEWHFCTRIVSRSGGIKGTVAKYFLLTSKWYLENFFYLSLI